jgi:hypothetical protein
MRAHFNIPIPKHTSFIDFYVGGRFPCLESTDEKCFAIADGDRYRIYEDGLFPDYDSLLDKTKLTFNSVTKKIGVKEHSRQEQFPDIPHKWLFENVPTLAECPEDPMVAKNMIDTFYDNHVIFEEDESDV